MAAKGPVAIWDITIPSIDMACTPAELRLILAEGCHKYCFQLEEGDDTGYEHWQVRVSLIKKSRWPKPDFPLLPPSAHWSITSNAGVGTKFSYVMKTDTRLQGPWTDRDEATAVPRQLRGITLMPWQEEVIERSQEFETRAINVLVDPVGGTGKSTLSLWMEVHKMALQLAVVVEPRDIARQVCSQPIAKCYLIDFPRFIDRRKIGPMMAAIEELKNGRCYDDRYSFKKKIFDSPSIWVFCNEAPNSNYLTNDRWVYWEILEGGILHRTGTPE